MKPSGKEQNKIRLQVFLSHNGVCSRRDALDIIKEGRVRVNGHEISEPSFQVNTHKDSISVDGKVIKPKRYEYIVLNKPKGFVTTKQGQFAQKSVYALLPDKYGHLSPVGRLDKDTEGLLLLTNDGDTAYRLTHPKFNIDKVYFVHIKGALEFKTKQKLERGIYVQGARTSPAKISQVKTSRQETSLYMTIHEGKKRQIRIMFAKMKHKVDYLKRISQGPLKLGHLKTGEFRVLTPAEKEKLVAIK